MTRRRRSGAAAVEFAVICPVAFTLLCGIIIGGLGVFRFHELSTLAREAARYASVHGVDYAYVTKNPAATATDIQNYVLSKAVALDASRLTCTVSWNTTNAATSITYVGGAAVQVANTVTVTLTYQWVPETYFTTGSTMRASSTVVMSF